MGTGTRSLIKISFSLSKACDVERLSMLVRGVIKGGFVMSMVHHGRVGRLVCWLVEPHHSSWQWRSYCMCKPCTLELVHLTMQAVREDHS